MKEIGFTEKHVIMPNEDKVIIKYARKRFLYDDREPWSQKDSSLFYVAMSAFDGVAVCNLVGTILL